MKPTTAGCRRGLALVATVTVAAWGGAATAVAHDSNFDGHYTLSGVHWQLNYLTYTNSYTPNCGIGYPGYHHYHYVNHNYRQVANSGPYYFYHQRLHWVSCTASGMPVRADRTRKRSFQAAPAVPERAELERALCRRFDLYCKPGRPGLKAGAATAALRDEVGVSLLRITPALAAPAPLIGAATTVANRTDTAAPGECVVGVLDREGLSTPVAGEIDAGVVLEVASPEVAASLGHPC